MPTDPLIFTGFYFLKNRLHASCNQLLPQCLKWLKQRCHVGPAGLADLPTETRLALVWKKKKKKKDVHVNETQGKFRASFSLAQVHN